MKCGGNMKKTEQLIINTFLELVEEKPLDKITIQDIANKKVLSGLTFPGFHFWMLQAF